MSSPEPSPVSTSTQGEPPPRTNFGPVGPPRDLTGATLGDFQVDRLLGRGGMGEVYLARQVSLNREIALKVLRPDLLTNPKYLDRFEAEAWSAAKLNDPNIVHIYSLGSIDGVRFIAMEYVQGTNLRDYLAKKGPPDLTLALSIMRQAGQAVRAAGEMGLVHRDIKPENLLMTRKGLVKVADFGLCRDLDSNKPSVTQEGVTMGTPLYMSPEQAQGLPLGHQSDLYSLGVTYYHMLAGQPPFRGETAIAVALKHVKDTPVDLSVHRPDLPPDLCRLVMKLMAKTPNRRYQAAAEMLRDLAKIREAVLATSPTLPDAATASPAVSLVDLPAGVVAESAGSRVARDRSGSGRLAMTEADPVGEARPRRTGLAALVLGVSLAAGTAVGWSLRPADLLSPGAKGPTGPPALWMAPAWAEVERQPSPELQYRFAQVRADPADLAAAWLAVPGYFPGARDWSARAYTQLARLLFREGDAAKLSALAAGLAKGDRGAQEKRLAGIVAVAAGVLRGDSQGVIDEFGQPGDYLATLTDPALAELSLEIALAAERVARRTPTSTRSALDNLLKVQRILVQKTVNIMFRDVQGRPDPL